MVSASADGSVVIVSYNSISQHRIVISWQGCPGSFDLLLRKKVGFLSFGLGTC